MESLYVKQKGINSGVDYVIDNIAGDGTTWNPVTISEEIRSIDIKCRADNDLTSFIHNDSDTEFHFAKTATPGNDWVDLLGLHLPITKAPDEIIGYVQSAAGTFVVIFGLK